MPTAPYPGLRPFKIQEHGIFFGQEQNRDALFQRLAQHRFIAVLGESGCGKSSLVRAGLIPMVEPARVGAVRSWRVIVTQPGMNPILNLSRALQRLTEDAPVDGFGDIESLLSRDPLSLIKIAGANRDKTTRFLLVVVDQFEELFRFRREGKPGSDDQAALYVKILLNAAQAESANVYVLITMRSEYLGEASQFYRLAEAISDGLFLLPRMKRVQCEDAIVQPALEEGAEIPQSVVQRLLNETEEREDGLPLLQHGLRRLWDTSQFKDQTRTFALPKELERSGAEYVQWCLNEHLDEILADLNLQERTVAAKAFKLLGDWDSKGRLIRRATEWRDIKAIGPTEAQVLKVIDAFRDEKLGRTFLVPSKEERPSLKDHDKLDISHEVLLRRWNTYSEWLRQEAEDSARYYWLADAADRWAKEERGFLQGLELVSLATWHKQFQPSAAWASRYTGGMDGSLKRNQREYHSAMDFLAKSEQEFEKEEARRLARQRKRFWGSVSALIAIALVLLAFLGQQLRAKANLEKTVRQTAKILSAAGVASEEGGVLMDMRVPDALFSAEQAKVIGKGLPQELLRRIRLDQWELFSTLRKGDTISLVGIKGASDARMDMVINSKCGVAVATFHDGTFVAVADGESIQIWRLGLRTPIAHSPFKDVGCVEFSPDGNRLLAVSYTPSDDLGVPSLASSIRVFSFDHRTLSPIRDGDVATGIKSLIGVSFVGAQKIGALTNTSLTIYQPNQRPVPTTLKQRARIGFFSPDGLYVVLAYENGAAQIQEVASNRPPRDVPFSHAARMGSNRDSLQSATFSRDSSRIVTGSSQGWVGVQGNPYCNDCLNNARFVPVARMASSITTVAWGASAELRNAQNREGEMLAVGTANGDAAVFTFRSTIPSQPRASEPGIDNLANQYEAYRFAHQDEVTRVSFSEDGEKLITGSADQKARVFEIPTETEIARIPHNGLVFFAVAAGGYIVSVSGDETLQITAFDENSLRTVRRDWPKKACAPRGSAVSPTGTLVWACSDDLQSLDSQLTAPNETSGLVGITFSRNGSALAWLDSVFRRDGAGHVVFIHYMQRVGQQVHRASAALPIPADRQNPVLAVSPNGEFIAVSFCQQDVKTECWIDLFRGTEKTISLAERFEAGNATIFSLAVGSDGSVAAGTVDGSVLSFREASKESPARPVRTSTLQNPTVANDRYRNFITAISITTNGEILAARGDQWIGLYSGALKLLFPAPGAPATVLAYQAPAQELVLSSDDEQFAAISGSFATFFTITRDGHAVTFDKGLTLHEPGTIQSLSFVNQSIFVTAVATRNSVLRIEHNLNIGKHEEWICRHQPTWATEETIADCQELGYGQSSDTKEESFWDARSTPLSVDIARK